MIGILLCASRADIYSDDPSVNAPVSCNQHGIPITAHDRLAMIITAARAGHIDSVNGLAISKDLATVFATHWLEIANVRQAALVSYHFGDCELQFNGMLFPESKYNDYQPKLSANDRELFFTSTRPVGDSTQPARQNIWFTTTAARKSGWTAPKLVRSLASSHWDGHAVLTNRGYLYFASERPGGHGLVDIYRTAWNEQRIDQIENVRPLNSAASDQDFFLSPDEDFIIFSRYDPSSQDIDLYYSIRVKSSWTTARPLAIANTKEWELSPLIDPSGQYLLLKRGHARGFATIDFSDFPKELAAAISN